MLGVPELQGVEEALRVPVDAGEASSLPAVVGLIDP
jgi:hypothetical protein